MLHIIQNDPEVPPGSLTDLVAAVPHRVHHPYRDGLLPAVADISALLVLGGAMGANDESRYSFLADLKQLIRSVVAAGLPYFGICLGGQLLAAALGATVSAHRWEEIGHFSAFLTEEGGEDRLFRGIAPEFPVFQWHHDSFDIPAGGILLASSAACPHQAFRIGTRAWGVQFHPEVTGEIIRCWSAWQHSPEAEVAALLAAYAARNDAYTVIISHLMKNFLLSADLPAPW